MLRTHQGPCSNPSRAYLEDMSHPQKSPCLMLESRLPPAEACPMGRTRLHLQEAHSDRSGTLPSGLQSDGGVPSTRSHLRKYGFHPQHSLMGKT